MAEYQLYLVRHGVAEERGEAWPDDAKRPLTGNGATLDKDALLRLTPAQRSHAREVGVLPDAGRSPKPEARSPTTGPTDAARLAAVDPRDEIVPMSSLRKRVAERLVQAQHESASLTTFNEVDMTAIMELRARFNRLLREWMEATAPGPVTPRLRRVA